MLFFYSPSHPGKGINSFVLTFLVFCFFLFSGCDLFERPTISIEQQLRYQPFLRGEIQMVVRFFPLLIHSFPPGGVLLGDPPVVVPSTFPSQATTLASLPGLYPSPQTLVCDLQCTLLWERYEWGNGVTFSLPYRPEDGVWERGEGLYRTSFFGDFSLLLFPDGLYSFSLTGSPFGKINRWDGEFRSREGKIQFQYGGVFSGEIVRSSTEFRSATTLPPLFPWKIHPRSLFYSFSLTDGRVEWRLEYEGGESFLSRWHPQEKEWIYKSVKGVSGTLNGNRWVEEFPREGVIMRIEHTFSSFPFSFPFTSTEIRYLRLGNPVRRELRWEFREKPTPTVEIFVNAEPFSGVVRILLSPPALRFQGFYESIYGELITFEGFWFYPGFLFLDFSGFNPSDTVRPAEEGEWVLFPDGSLKGEFLFRQVTGSYAGFSVISPPEGISEKGME